MTEPRIGPSPPADPPEALVEYAAALYGITYPPGPLRTAAVVGAMLSRGLDAAACSALAVEQMGAALEARGREAARLANMRVTALVSAARRLSEVSGGGEGMDVALRAVVDAARAVGR